MLLGGTTVAPGTGGVTKATDSSELFLMDANTHEVRWRGAPVPGAKTITDLMVGTDGLVYGLADSVDLFVFNPNNRQVVSVNRFSKDLGPSVYAQGTRAFVKGADGSIYVLLYNGIGKVDAKAHTVSRVYRLLFVLMIVLGGFMDLEAVWIIADIVNALMALPNLIALLALSPIIISETKKYFDKHKKN